MKFIKKINNNVAWALTDKDQEVIVIGKGVSFDKEINDPIPLNSIEKYYYSDDPKNKMMDSVLQEIKENIFDLTEHILDKAKQELKIHSITVSNLIALADHLNHALKRSTEEIFDYPDNLKWEVKRIYPKEYDFATEVLFLIEKQTDIRLPKSEVTFLTYHFVNLQYGSDIKKKSYELADLLNKSLEIIQYHFHMTLDQNSINYIRFVTHVRHFVLRQMNKEYLDQSVIDMQLLKVVKNNYKKSYQAAEKISKMIELNLDCTVSDDEKFYLTLHIERVTKK